MADTIDIVFYVGSLFSVAGGAGLGVWFAINPPSEQTVTLVEHGLAGGIVGFIAFLGIGLVVAMISGARTGGDR